MGFPHLFLKQKEVRSELEMLQISPIISYPWLLEKPNQKQSPQ